MGVAADVHMTAERHFARHLPGHWSHGFGEIFKGGRADLQRSFQTVHLAQQVCIRQFLELGQQLSERLLAQFIRAQEEPQFFAVDLPVEQFLLRTAQREICTLKPKDLRTV